LESKDGKIFEHLIDALERLKEEGLECLGIVMSSETGQMLLGSVGMGSVYADAVLGGQIHGINLFIDNRLENGEISLLIAYPREAVSENIADNSSL
jgi:hypothetical protein